jgi:polysaccharide deacetylase family protein (PEP-CTERM system associated)
MNRNAFSIDVEDWYHILDSPLAPPIDQWDRLESRVRTNTIKILRMLNQHDARATLFWLGWVAERHPDLVRQCHADGHEIASHGYAHLLAYKVGRAAFREDLVRSKEVLENIIGAPVHGFRAPGFSVTEETPWVFDEIRAAGYAYDSSIFPASRGHGGMIAAPLAPYVIQTGSLPLVELPQSLIHLMGKRISLFGGGYLRLAPLSLIRWGVRKLHREGRPLIIYIHPREVDPGHPRLPLSWARRIKCYVNLETTVPKLNHLMNEYRFTTMRDLAEEIALQQGVAGACFPKLQGGGQPARSG